MAMAVHADKAALQDKRRVALIKNLATNNRFYALVTPESGMRNADIVECIPDDLLLGIAYPCLEDGLNDFAVIRTTFETMDCFADDPEMRDELMQIIAEARTKLVLRLSELHDRIAGRKAHFLGADLEEFKSYVLDIVHRGYPRRNLDSMMKLNVFGSVATEEGNGNGSEPLFRYEFRGEPDLPTVSQLPARDFVAMLFLDVLESVNDAANYECRFTFDRNVFQKFIALMFVNYATTDPIFYGTNKADYGVSDTKEMDDTPLYRAIARELRAIEALARRDGVRDTDSARLGHIAVLDAPEPVALPDTLVNEDALLGPIAAIHAASQQLRRQNDREASEFARIICNNASQLVRELKRLGIVSQMAYDPGEAVRAEDRASGNGC